MNNLNMRVITCDYTTFDYSTFQRYLQSDSEATSESIPLDGLSVYTILRFGNTIWSLDSGISRPQFSTCRNSVMNFALLPWLQHIRLSNDSGPQPERNSDRVFHCLLLFFSALFFTFFFQPAGFPKCAIIARGSKWVPKNFAARSLSLSLSSP